MPKMHQNTLGGALALLRPSSCRQGVPTSKGPTSKGRKGKRREKGGMAREGWKGGEGEGKRLAPPPVHNS